MKKVLFLGDSITDAQRSYQEDEHHYIGQGYTEMVAGKLALEHPGMYEFTNKGISGNRIVDLYARIKKDCWNLKPDYISILIGVNDVWHELEDENGVDAKRITTAGMTKNEIKRAAAAALNEKGGGFSSVKAELIITGKGDN
jgi:lysophospholipase L1-like esterase